MSASDAVQFGAHRAPVVSDLMAAETLRRGVFSKHLSASQCVSPEQTGPEGGEGVCGSGLGLSGWEGVGERGPGHRFPEIQFEFWGEFSGFPAFDGLTQDRKYGLVIERAQHRQGNLRGF